MYKIYKNVKIPIKVYLLRFFHFNVGNDRIIFSWSEQRLPVNSSFNQIDCQDLELNFNNICLESDSPQLN